ncbi:MAG: hypothetical protein JWO82_817 [Akkermansiaceae bacterium]|nr:hypothetical protein [Akkermansiaceae bacterium]
MKTLIFPAFLLLGAAPSARAVDFIRQIQLIHNQSIVYDIPISGTTGSIASKTIEGDGAVFQLYAYPDQIYSPFTIADVNVGTLVNANIQLDSNLVNLNLLGIHLNISLGGTDPSDPGATRVAEKTVGTYFPQASVTLTSEDTYYPPRTRADRPYGFKLSIRKLLAQPTGVTTYSGPTKITLEREYKLYDSTSYNPSTNGSGQGTYSSAYEFTKNGDFADPSIYQSLPAARPTKAVGEETFAAYVQVNAAGSMARVSASTIQVWPVAEATIDGIDDGKRYLGVPPNVKTTLKDLYPDSVTYAQIYKGAANVGTTGYIIPSTVLSYNTFSPQNAMVPIAEMEKGITTDGTYTIEILTTTPFNQRKPEVLASKSFVINRSLDVQGYIGTSN